MTWIRRYKQEKSLHSGEKLFPKFQLIPILRSQVTIMCVSFSTHTLLNELSSTTLSIRIPLISYWNDFSLIPWGNMLLRGELRKDAKLSNFYNFESTFYLKSRSIPIGNFILFRNLESKHGESERINTNNTAGTYQIIYVSIYFVS